MNLRSGTASGVPVFSRAPPEVSAIAATFGYCLPTLRVNGAYIVPKTLRDSFLRRPSCGALSKMMFRETFSISLSNRRSCR